MSVAVHSLEGCGMVAPCRSVGLGEALGVDVLVAGAGNICPRLVQL